MHKGYYCSNYHSGTIQWKYTGLFFEYMLSEVKKKQKCKAIRKPKRSI